MSTPTEETKKYSVTLEVTVCKEVTIEVDASSEEEAETMAYDIASERYYSKDDEPDIEVVEVEEK